ncbi:MAG: YbaN family protein [Asticcacaulis sp.]
MNLLGLFFVALGVIGAFLPVMPTTIFLIIAAIIFAKSNPAWEAKIMEHPKYGPPIRDFRERGIIGPKAKCFAVGGMAVSSIISYFLIDGYWAFAPAITCGLCAIYVLSRPSR